MKIVVDSYAWVELFRGSREGEKVKQAMEESENLYTPDTVLAELSRKLLREHVSEKEVGKRLEIVEASSRILALTGRLAVLASRAYFELAQRAKEKKLTAPSLFDGIVLGASRLVGGRVLTDDPHFRGLPETTWV